jgi:riboflavin synthase
VFTGIIEETGTIQRLEPRADVLVVSIQAGRVLEDLPPGGSIAVNGCCLTAVSLAPDGFSCELTRETLQRTAFDARLRPGARVNLERPMRASGRFDGHIVQGHVDGLGEVRELRRTGDSAELQLAAPPALERYLVEKGSVAVEGVSLTVARLEPRAFTIALIPYTLSATNLGGLRPGDRVNLEVDVIAKYVERLLAFRDG